MKAIELEAHWESHGGRFSAVVGNPPYQVPQPGRLKDEPIFQEVASVGFTLSELSSFIYPARWLYWHQRQQAAFKEAELTHKGYSRFLDWPGDSDVFPEVAIAGGVCTYLRHRETQEAVAYTAEGLTEERTELAPRGILVRNASYGFLRGLVGERSLAELVGAYGYYLGAEVTRQAIEKMLTPKSSEHVAYLKNREVVVAPIKEGSFRRPPEGWKVFVSKTANSQGGRLRRADRIFLGEPGVGCAVSFLRVGPFKTKVEAERCLAYMKTDFANFLLGVNTVSHNTTAQTYKLLPLVDFSTGELLNKPGTYLDFTEPESLDEQLARAYGLTAEEVGLMGARLKRWPS